MVAVEAMEVAARVMAEEATARVVRVVEVMEGVMAEADAAADAAVPRAGRTDS